MSEVEKAYNLASTQVNNLNKLLADTDKQLIHERRLREDIQNGAIAAKESILVIRQMHQVNDLECTCCCGECNLNWPCPTILAIREPEQATIAALQILERELHESVVHDQTKDNDSKHTRFPANPD